MQDRDALYFARNLDWHLDAAMVIVNGRGVRKTSITPPNARPAKWISKYGSVTFNQFGQEMPFGGMNEAGLVIECMWLNSVEYPEEDSRPAINPLQWIQIHLDTCATVAEALASAPTLRIYGPNDSGRIHYLLCDATGMTAVIEVLKGKLVVHSNLDTRFKALANDAYDPSKAHASLVSPEAPKGSSLWRFCKAAERAASFKSRNESENIQYAFDSLDAVSQGEFTVWNVVYDLSRKAIHYRTSRNRSPRHISFPDLDFSCAENVQSLDIQTGFVEARDLWKPLSQSRHKEYLEALISKPEIIAKLGDLKTQIAAQQLILRTFRCNSHEVSDGEPAKGRLERAK